MVFKGIPYAAPVGGNMRWKAPVPPKSWKGILKADRFGPSCMQDIVHERKPWTYEFMIHGDISENCLSLNVWMAAKSTNEKRPVKGGALIWKRLPVRRTQGCWPEAAFKEKVKAHGFEVFAIFAVQTGGDLYRHGCPEWNEG